MLKLAPDLQVVADGLEADLRSASLAIGLGLRAEIARMKPALARHDEDTPTDAELHTLDLERDGIPDAISLVACIEAHRAYVASRGEPEGVSLGALAVARLLVWGTRASMLGPAPRVRWIGPPTRTPQLAAGELTLTSTAVATVDGTRRTAAAVAIIAPPG